MTNIEVTARNFSASSENKIHSDEVAKKYGFRGALVPGVAVYGHLSRPLVQAYGAAWLGHSANTLRLLKPAYHGEKLLLALSQTEAGDLVTCHNPLGELLAEVKSSDTLPELPDLSVLDAAPKPEQRVEISWQTVNPGETFVPWRFEISAEANQTYTQQVDDPQDLFSDYAHPHLLQHLANAALVKEQVMPTWMHVGTDTCHRSALRVGDEVTVRSAVLDKWQKKGHEFIRIWVTLWRGDELTTDMHHTAIFKVAS